MIGGLEVNLRFEILSADVATILGMPFLEVCNPQINWARKTMKIKHRGKLINIPTLNCDTSVLTPQPVSNQNGIITSNSYDGLDVDHDADVDVDDIAHSDAAIVHASSQQASTRSKQPNHTTPQDNSTCKQPTTRQLLRNQLNSCNNIQDMLVVCKQFDDAQPNTCSKSNTTHTHADSPSNTCSNIEQVQLHTFMRGMRKNMYLNSFVMVGNDLLQSQCNTIVSTGSSSSSNVDISQVSLHHIEQCNLVGGTERVICALKTARELHKPTAQLSCPHCNYPHLDTESTCHDDQRNIHVCANAHCRQKYRNSTGAFGNPLAMYDIDSNNVLVKRSPAQLSYIHRHAHGQQGTGDHTTLQALAESTMSHLKQKYSSVFKEPTYPVQRDSTMQHSIKLIDPTAAPPKRRLYPLNDDELVELKAQIELFLETNRIKPSKSPYGAPILFARKKDGRLRMCIDYRALNSQTVPDSFPLPRIDELLARLQGAKYFSKLDLRDGYHQIPVAEDSQPLTAFTCRYGTYEWLVMPFGLCNAPGTFQRVMNHVFFDLLDRGVLVYLDDILIYSRTQDEHVKVVDEVFRLLEKHKLYIKESKCALFLEQVEFLGHVISHNGVAVDQGKTDAIRDWPVPSTVNQVQQFMGLANYYRKFVYKFGEIARPLTSLTRKNVVFSWTNAQQKAFDTLKQLLCNAPVLKVFDPLLETRIICDASDYAIGSVLEQLHESDWHPVEYISKSLSSAEVNYSATEREFVAIRYSLEKWHHLLINRKFKIYTDHAALTYLQSSSHVSRRNARWLEFLSQFNFEMLHVRGDSNIADHLSRITPISNADLSQLNSFISVFDSSALMQQVKLDQQNCTDKWYTTLLDKSQQKQYVNTIQVRNGILCVLHEDYFCPVVTSTNTQQQILRDLHASALGGHLGFMKLYQLVKSRFYWHNMRRHVDMFCKQCLTCQQNKVSTTKPAGLLQPLPIPTTVFESISMDFVTHLPKSNGYDGIFSVVDRFSKYCKFIPFKCNATAPDIANLLFEHWICQFGMPSTIVSDRDAKFTSKFWQALMKSLSCKVAMSTAYHPQSDGQTERFHRSIEQVLRCFVGNNQDDWASVLAQCQFALNSTCHAGTQHSPHHVVFLRHPRLPLDAAIRHVRGQPVEAVSELIRLREKINHEVTRYLHAANQYAQRHANTKRRHLEFSVGDSVLLSTAHLPLPAHLSRKLAPKFLGPLSIVERIGPVAYRLALPPNLARLHDVFHVGLLKPVAGSPEPARPPVFTAAEDSPEFEVERITAHRMARGGRRQYLVQWRGYPAFEATWEPEGNLKNSPELLGEYKKQHLL